MVVFPDALKRLARDGSAGATAMRVLFWAWAELDHENWSLILQSAVADDLKMSPPAVRKGLKRLLAEGILERRGRNPRQEWRLTPMASWDRGVVKYHEALQTRLAGVARSIEAETIPRPPRARKARAGHGEANGGA